MTRLTDPVGNESAWTFDTLGCMTPETNEREKFAASITTPIRGHQTNRPVRLRRNFANRTIVVGVR
jgi:hypothetical protein